MYCNSIFIQICTRHTCTRFSVFKHRVVLFSGPILLPVVASSTSSVVRTCSYGSLPLVEGLLGSVADLLHHQVCHCQVSNLLTMFLFVCGRLSCTLKNKYLLPCNPQQQHPVDEYPQAATCPVFVWLTRENNLHGSISTYRVRLCFDIYRQGDCKTCAIKNETIVSKSVLISFNNVSLTIWHSWCRHFLPVASGSISPLCDSEENNFSTVSVCISHNRWSMTSMQFDQSSSKSTLIR